MRKRKGKSLELDVSTGWIKPSYFVFAFLILASFAFAEACNDTVVTENLTLTENTTYVGGESVCYIVSAPDVTIDCDGFSITGDGTGTGIYSDQNGTRVENCNIGNFQDGLFFLGDPLEDGALITEMSIINTNIIGSTSYGFSIQEVQQSTFSNITSTSTTNSACGVYGNSTNNTFNHLNLTGTGYAYALDMELGGNDGFNTFGNSTMTSDRGDAIYLNGASNNAFENITATSTNSVAIYLYSSTGNTISNASATSTNNIAIYLASSTGNTISNASATSTNSVAIYIDTSNSNIFTNITATSTTWAGIYLYTSSNNTFTSSTISTEVEGTDEFSAAIIFDLSAPENNLTSNTINAPSANGISLGYSDAGAFILNNTILSGGYCFITIGDLDTYLGNNCTSDLWVSDSSELGNTFNDSTSGNIWNKADGTPASAFCDISGTTWATSGTDLPFEAATPCLSEGEWVGSSFDAFPWAGTEGNTTPPAGCDVMVGQGDMPFTANVPNTVYCQSESITVDDTDALLIADRNITYDCQGYEIETTTSGLAIHDLDYNNTIKNCAIYSAGIGIYLEGGNGTVINNNISSSGSSIILFASNRNNITGNDIGGNGQNGILITGTFVEYLETVAYAAYNTIENNGVNIGSDGAGIELGQYAPANTISGNDILISSVGNSTGIRLWSSADYSLIYNNTIASDGFCIATNGTSDTYLLNNCTSNLWVNDSTGGNTFSTSTYGNIWNLANGTPAKSFCDIIDGTGNGFADAGTDLPFNNATTCLDINGTRTWDGYGADNHPYTGLSSVYLDYCNGSDARAVTWIAYDLLTNERIAFNITSNIQQVVGGSLQAGNFTGGANSSSNFSLCVFPPEGTVYAQLTDTITSPGYAPIPWYHFPTNYNSSSTTYTVYLLATGNNSKLVQIFVVDNTYTPLLNVSVKIQQISPITSENILLGSFLVDSFGSTTQTLQPVSQLYHFSVLSSTGSLLQDYSNRAIPCSSTELVCQLILVVNPITLPIDLTSLSGSCSYDGGTRDITCTGTDTSGSIQFLNVSAFGLGGSGAVCSNQSAGASGTLVCTLPNINGTYNGFFFGIDAGGYNHLIDQGTYTVGTGGQTNYGRDGFLAVIMLVVIAATLMTSSIAVSMTMGVFGMFVGLAFGIVPLNLVIVAIIFAVVAFVISYRLKV